MASALARLASAAEFVALPGAILAAYFTTSRSTEPKRGRYGKKSASASKGSVSSSSGSINRYDGKDTRPDWYPRDRW